MTDMTVANTILEQLGGRMFVTMTGAKEMIGSDNSLTMRVNGRYNSAVRVNLFRVILDANDTYTVKAMFLSLSTGKLTLVAESSDIYCDGLQDAFERMTGLFTTLHRRQG
jgi:hypothetical protein